MTYEYMRGNGTGQAKNETLYTYDALNRLVTAHDNYGNSTRTYTYDSLGNLTYETGIGSHNCDYIYNNLNQQVDRSSDNWKSHTASTYDNRGNLILEQYGKNKKLETAGEYTYDETNKMVRGVNGNAEESIYTYNGLGALMENTWIIAKNGYGYHDASGEEDTTSPTDPTPDVPDPGETTDPDTPDPGETTDPDTPDPDTPDPDTPDPDTPDPGETTDPDTPDDGDDTDPDINNEVNGNNNGNNGNHNGNGNGNGNNGNGNGKGNGKGSNSADSTETAAADAGTLTASLVAYGNAGNGNNGNNGNGNGNQDQPTGSDVKKTSTVVKQFVVDFSSETYKPLMEHEVNGLDYRYVYSDKARLSVVVQGIENGSASLLDSRGELHAYYHCDYLGTTDYLTSAVNSKVIS